VRIGKRKSRATGAHRSRRRTWERGRGGKRPSRHTAARYSAPPFGAGAKGPYMCRALNLSSRRRGDVSGRDVPASLCRSPSRLRAREFRAPTFLSPSSTRRIFTGKRCCSELFSLSPVYLSIFIRMTDATLALSLSRAHNGDVPGKIAETRRVFKTGYAFLLHAFFSGSPTRPPLGFVFHVFFFSLSLSSLFLSLRFYFPQRRDEGRSFVLDIKKDSI